MKKIISNPYLLLFSRFILAVVFIFAAVDKIIAPENFSEAVSNYRLFPIETTNIIAIIVPWIELVCGMLLLFGISVRENSIILGSMLFLFTSIIIISIIRGLNIDCGCYGTAHAQTIGVKKVLENILLLVLSVHLFLFSTNKTGITFL